MVIPNKPVGVCSPEILLWEGRTECRNSWRLWAATAETNGGCGLLRGRKGDAAMGRTEEIRWGMKCAPLAQRPLLRRGRRRYESQSNFIAAKNFMRPMARRNVMQGVMGV